MLMGQDLPAGIGTGLVPVRDGSREAFPVRSGPISMRAVRGLRLSQEFHTVLAGLPRTGQVSRWSFLDPT